MWIVLVIVVVVILILGCMPISGGMSRKEAEFSDQAYKLHIKGVDATTYKKAEEALIHYEMLYSEARSQTKLMDEHIYEEDLQDIRENMETLATEEWQKKAGIILDKFAELYYMITNPAFQDIDKAYRSKKRCIDYWHKYFFSIPEDGIWRDPKGFMKEYLGEDFDACMYSLDTLEKKLSKCIEEMQPEYKRKVRLKKDIADLVERKQSVLRSELLRAKFSNATEKEIQYCYKELIANNILVEIKIGNRFFVYLSDKEKAKREKHNRG